MPRTVEELTQENDLLRYKLASGIDKCIYCGLPAEDMNKCAHGFPGCARGDDLMVALSCNEDADTYLFPRIKS